MIDEVKERIKKGYVFFYGLKPSEVKPVHILWLHEWLRLLSGEKKIEPIKDDLTPEEMEKILS